MDDSREILLCRWAGPDLFDTAEQEAMTLTVRAINRVACEAVSLIRNALRPKKPLRDGPGPYIPEPIQDDAWVSFRFPLRGTTIDSVVTWVPEDDAGVYAFAFRTVTTMWQKLLGNSPKAVPADLQGFIDAAFGGSKLLRIERWVSERELHDLIRLHQRLLDGQRFSLTEAEKSAAHQLQESTSVLLGELLETCERHGKGV